MRGYLRLNLDFYPNYETEAGQEERGNDQKIWFVFKSNQNRIKD
jgi:hypothetical protein